MASEAGAEVLVVPENISPTIVRLGKASLEMGNLIQNACIAERNITPANIPTAEIICRDGIGIDGNSTLDEVLQRAASENGEKPLRVALYNSGISKGIEGDVKASRVSLARKEVLMMKVGDVIERGIKGQIIPEEAFENKETAADFLIEEGVDVAIMVVPRQENIYSSLAVDAVARGTVLKKIRESAVVPEIYAFSDGGFKEFQIHFAAFTAIADDLRFAAERGMIPNAQLPDIDTAALERVLSDVKRQWQTAPDFDQPTASDAGKREHLWKKTFSNGFDALEYMEAQSGTDIIIGSAPADVYELAIIPAYHSQLVKRFAQSMARLAVNKSIQTLAHNEHRYIVDTILSGNYFSGIIELFISRLLEIGRAKSPHDRDFNRDDIAFKLASNLMAEKLGAGRIIYLADLSGHAVATAAGGITKGESLFFGANHTVLVETHPELDPRNSNGKLVPAVHEELKTDGAVQAMQAFAAASKLELLSGDNKVGVQIAGRYIPTSGEIIGIDQNGATLRRPYTFRMDRYRQLLERRNSLLPQEQALLSRVETAFNSNLVRVDLQPKFDDVVQKLIPIEVGDGKILNVSVKVYRPENIDPRKSIQIYCQGMSYTLDGPLNKIEQFQVEQARKNGEIWVAVGLEGAVLDKKEVSLNDDALIIVQALEQEQIDLARSVNICGHSAGSAMALALAGAIKTLQEDKYLEGGLPQNKLRLFSLTGVIDLNDWTNGYNLILNALREKVTTEIMEMVEYYQSIAGRLPDIKGYGDIIHLMREISDIKKRHSSTNQQLNRDKNADDIALARRRFADLGIREILGHMRELEQRNPICDRFGDNWEVEMKLSRTDLIYPWILVKRTIDRVKRDMVVLQAEGIGHRVIADIDKLKSIIESRAGESARPLQRGAQWLFANARR